MARSANRNAVLQRLALGKRLASNWMGSVVQFEVDKSENAI